MKQLAILALTLTTLAIASISYADIITVEYQSTNSGYSSLSGTFVGDDVNDDGMIVFSELTDWFTNYSNAPATFTALNDLGDFNYMTNVWTPNAYQWDGSTQDAYMTWNNWNYSASTSNYGWVFTTTVDVDAGEVPEPTTMLLFGTGLIGLLGYNRKRLVQKR